MEERTGEIINPTDQMLRDIETGTEKRYENPARIPLNPGFQVDYLEMIARTPNGDKVIQIIKGIRN